MTQRRTQKRDGGGVIPSLQARGRGIQIVISGDGESARKALEMVQEQLRKTAERAAEEGGAIEKAMERVKLALEYVGIYAGIRETIEGIKELVGGSLELGESMLKLSERTGLSVETLSTLHYAAAVTGSDFDGLVNGVGRMEKTIGLAADGNKQASALIKALGLDAKDLASRTDGAEVAFHRFVQTLAATESPIRRNELAMQLMGKAGSAQIPVLIEIAQHWDEFKQKADDAGVLLTSETAKALADTNQRFADMEQHIKGAGLAFTEGLAPGVSQFLAIITGGKSQLETFDAAGKGIAKTFAFVGEVIYSAAAAAEMLFALSEGVDLTEAGSKDAAAARELKKQAEEMHKLAFGDAPTSTNPLISGGEGTPGVPGFGGDPAGGGKIKSFDGIAKAAADLAEEQGKAMAAAQKAIDEKAMAELDAQHKMGLVADADYFQEKLRLQDEMLDAEAASLVQKNAELQGLLEKQHADKGLKRDGSGRSAEELRTQRELLQVQEQMAALDAKRAQFHSQVTEQQNAGNMAATLNQLKIAADLEKERNDGVTARIALLRYEKDLEAQKVKNAGGSDADVATVRSAEELAVKQLQVEDINRRIQVVLNDNVRATKAWNDEAEKNPLMKGKATQQINQLNQQAADEVKGLVDQYYALAVTMGGPTLEAAKNLRAEIEKLQTPTNKGDAQFQKTLTEGITKMANTLTEQTIRGKTSFKEMVKEIEADSVELALKLAEQQFLKPGGAGGGSSSGTGGGFFAQLFGALAEHHMSGGTSSDGPQVVGEAGPELWMPPSGGGTVVPSAALASKLADSGGGGKAPNVTQTIINQSRQPVTASPPSVDYDEQLRSHIITVVLQDAATGGPMASFAGASGG